MNNEKIDECISRMNSIKYHPWNCKGYWRFQLEFLSQYTGNGLETKLLHHALRKLNLDPLDILEGIDCFYDSSAYICSYSDSLTVPLSDKVGKHIHTFNVNEFRIQYPVPNNCGKFTEHNLVIYNMKNGSRTIFSFDEGYDEIKISVIPLKLFKGCYS